MARKPIRIKQKPELILPEPKWIGLELDYVNFGDGKTYDELVQEYLDFNRGNFISDWAKPNRDDIYFSVPHSYYNSSGVELGAICKPSDIAIEECRAQFEEKLAEYNQWYEDNKEAIEAELVRREAKSQKAKKAQLIKKKRSLRQLQAEIKELENEK
jgi:hypothetical protein